MNYIYEDSSYLMSDFVPSIALEDLERRFYYQFSNDCKKEVI